jgi:hypothetical protein
MHSEPIQALQKVLRRAGWYGPYEESEFGEKIVAARAGALEQIESSESPVKAKKRGAGQMVCSTLLCPVQRHALQAPICKAFR